MSLSNEGIEYDIKDIKIHSDKYHYKFEELKNLSEGEKINIWSDTIYIDSSMYGTQWFLRKASGQGREVVKKYLTKNFEDYNQLLSMMIAAEGTIRYIDERYKQLLELMEANKQFIIIIIPGLEHTREIYKDDDDLLLTDVINNIISNLDSYIKSYDKLKLVYDTREENRVMPRSYIFEGNSSDPGTSMGMSLIFGIPNIVNMNRQRSISEL
mgnify:CR=1 FL=1